MNVWLLFTRIDPDGEIREQVRGPYTAVRFIDYRIVHAGYGDEIATISPKPVRGYEPVYYLVGHVLPFDNVTITWGGITSPWGERGQ